MVKMWMKQSKQKNIQTPKNDGFDKMRMVTK